MQSKPTQAHGPYIVTTWPECPGCTDPSSAPHLAKPPLSRRAVATLEEAQQAAWDACLGFDQAARDAAYSQLTDLGRGSDGSVGPLPDGTVIEVEPETYARLLQRIPMESWPMDWPFTAEQIIAAFNAAQAEGLMT